MKKLIFGFSLIFILIAQISLGQDWIYKKGNQPIKAKIKSIDANGTVQYKLWDNPKELTYSLSKNSYERIERMGSNQKKSASSNTKSNINTTNSNDGGTIQPKQENGKKGKKGGSDNSLPTKDCEAKNYGNQCFKNNTKQNVTVEMRGISQVDYPGANMNKRLDISPGTSECLYKVISKSYETIITFPGKSGGDGSYGSWSAPVSKSIEIFVEQCSTDKTYQINK